MCKGSISSNMMIPVNITDWQESKTASPIKAQVFRTANIIWTLDIVSEASNMLNVSDTCSDKIQWYKWALKASSESQSAVTFALNYYYYQVWLRECHWPSGTVTCSFWKCSNKLSQKEIISTPELVVCMWTGLKRRETAYQEYYVKIKSISHHGRALMLIL